MSGKKGREIVANLIRPRPPKSRVPGRSVLSAVSQVNLTLIGAESVFSINLREILKPRFEGPCLSIECLAVRAKFFVTLPR